MVQLLVGPAVFFFGSMLQGVAGFGLGLIGAPFLLMFYSTSMVTAMLAIFASSSNLVILWSLRRSVNRRLYLLLLAGAVFGIIPGAMIRHLVPLTAFKWIIGVLIIGCGGVLATGWQLKRQNDMLTVGVGFLAGVLGGCLSIAGAPVSIFLTAGELSKNEFRATISLFFLSVNVLVTAALALGGQLSFELVKLAPIYISLICLGSALGTRLGFFVPARVFRLVVICLIICSGASLLIFS